METNPSVSNMNPETMRSALELMNAGIMKNFEEAKSKELVDKYLKGSFMDDMVDALLPFMEEKLNVNEVKELTAIMQTERGKSYQEHSAKVNENMGKFQQMGVEIAQKVIGGEEPTAVQPIDCPDSYKQLFEQYYKASGQEGLLKSMFEGLNDSMTDEQKPKMEKVMNYLSSNLCTMLLNESYGSLTEDDMRFGIELGQTPAWQNQMEAVSSIMSNAQEVGMSIVMKYLTWLQDQGVETNM